MPSTVKLYAPILKAAWYYSNIDHLPADLPHILVEKKAIGANGSTSMYIVEMGLSDNSSLVVTATESTVRISHCETDGTRGPIMAFRHESVDTLTAVMLALFPIILNIDMKDYDGKLLEAVNKIGTIQDAASWADKNDIPEEAVNAFYYTDAALEIFKERLDIEFGPATSNVPDEVDEALFATNNGLSGSQICFSDLNGWTPKYVKAVGTAAKPVVTKMTIGQAKAEFSHFSASRKWSPIEEMMIPRFPDDMPVMAETLRIARRICNTRNDENPAANFMWRGVTSYGKSTGIKQLAAILNVPLLIQTCHPGMEITEFKSTYVPAGTTEGIELDMSNVSVKETADDDTTKPPFFDAALTYVKSLPKDKRDEVLSPATFFMTAMMDTEMATEELLGKVEAISAADLYWLYSAVCTEMEKAPLKAKIAKLEAAGNSEKKNDEPSFIHVISNYVKALVNGYIIEIQEASRIRDSGVLVGLNEFDRAGAMIPLMNGAIARRHKDAICVITDNVGYASCRPIDSSVLRRQALIIDSYELTKEQLLDRVKRNTGCHDTGLLELGYKLWSCVKEFCEQNSIVEGSVSPTELERFIQAVHYDGPDSISWNLNDCIISKATSSIEDQRGIRDACSAIYGVI
jgi:hypothetical protein